MRACPQAPPGATVRGLPRLLRLALAVALVAAHPVAAQAPAKEGPAEEQLPAVISEVVRLDVMVTEKGHPKERLTRRDFVVLEDGVPQTITLFEEFAPAAGVAPPPSMVAPGEEPETHPSPAPPQRPPPRFVVLAVDDIHIEFSNLARVKKALDHFIDADLVPGDRAALVTMSGARSQDLTDDRRVLKSAVAGLTLQERGVGRRFMAPYVTEYQAEQIVRGDPDALEVAVNEILYERPSEPNPVAEARMIARQMFDESVHNARITLETLESLVRGLARLPGRKVVVLPSDGFVTGLAVEGRAGFDMRRIADAATRAGVVIYSVDTRGLVAPTGFAASRRGPMSTSSFGLREQLLAQGEHATRQAMNALAADTGGFLYENSNNLGTGLRKILEDTDSYYLIAYEPTNTRRDGSFRKIEVRLPGEHGVRIRARTGYFAPDARKVGKEADARGPARPDLSESGVAERPESGLRAALAALGTLTDVPVRASADFVSVDGVEPMVVVSANVDLHGLRFDRGGGHHRGTVEVAATVFDEGGQIVGSLEPVRTDLDLKGSRYERAVENGLAYQRAAPLKPGRYRVRVAARDGTGRVGSAEQWVDVPRLSDGELRLSSVFLSHGGERSGEGAGSAGGALQEAQALRRFERNESLYVQAYVYNAVRAMAGKADVVATAEIWHGDTRVGSTPSKPIPQVQGGATPLSYARVFPLRSFQPGSYEVRILVTDRRAGATASGRVDFTVE